MAESILNFTILLFMVTCLIDIVITDSIPFSKESSSSSTTTRTTEYKSRAGVMIGGGGGGERDLYVLAYLNYTYRDTDNKIIEFSEEKSRYGEGRILNVYGQLVYVTKLNDMSDHTACSDDLRGNSGNPLPIRGIPWIALIRRGRCTFEEKVRHVYERGAIGAIIYNEQNTDNLEKMKIVDKERNITAVFTHKWIGENMARAAESGNDVFVSISEGRHIVKPFTNINKTSVLFVSISFIILMVISLIWLVFYYIQRFRYLQSKDQHSRHLCTVAKRIIMKIPTKSGKCEDKDSEIDCCAICIENYKSTDCIRVLPCRHEFHKNCVDPWLLEHRTCPMCKLDVLKHYGFVFLGSEESVLQLDWDMEISDDGIVRHSLPRQENLLQIGNNNLRRLSLTMNCNSGNFNERRRLSLQGLAFMNWPPLRMRRISGSSNSSDDNWPIVILQERSHSSLSRVNYQTEMNCPNSISYDSNFLSPANIRNIEMNTKCMRQVRPRSRSVECNSSNGLKISIEEIMPSTSKQNNPATLHYENKKKKNSKQLARKSSNDEINISSRAILHRHQSVGDDECPLVDGNESTISVKSNPPIKRNSCIKIQIDEPTDFSS